MPPRQDLVHEPRWTITPAGRRAIDMHELCLCDIRLTGVLLTCAMCGTIYGSMKDALKPKAQRWVNTRGR